MREYRRAAHTVYCLHYHFVFITKYLTNPVLRGEVGQELRNLIRKISQRRTSRFWKGTSGPNMCICC